MKEATQHNDAANSIKVAASGASASVEVRGQGAAHVTGALLDLLSPFSNLAGWVGDQLAYARRSAAIRAASKASEQLRAEGIVEGAVPPKILLPWIEGASLETEANETLTNAWAGLFVRAVKSSDAAVISYMETLKRLGEDEANLLEFFATDTSPSFPHYFYSPDTEGMFSPSNPLIGNVIKNAEKALSLKTLSEIDARFDTFGLQGMYQVIFYSTDKLGKRATPYFRKNEHAVANLQHLGLVETRFASLDTVHGELELVYFRITKYAFDLVWACRGVQSSGAPREKS